MYHGRLHPRKHLLPSRAVTLEGEPWFVAADVCRALGLGNSSMAVSKLDEDEKGISLIDTLGGEQKLGIVNESGLYALVLSSRKRRHGRVRETASGDDTGGTAQVF